MVGPVGSAGGQKSVKVVTFWLVLTGHFYAGTEGQTQPVNQLYTIRDSLPPPWLGHWLVTKITMQIAQHLPR